MLDFLKTSKTLWNEMASECKDAYFKEAILELFIPFDLSIRKCSANMQCIKTGGEESWGATPTAKYWSTTGPWDRPMGYDIWFYANFPDVAYWACSEQGLLHLKRLFGGLPKEQFIGSNDKITVPYLKKIIQAYIDYTHKRLETV